MPTAINKYTQSLLLDVADRSTFSQYKVRAGSLHITSQISLFLFSFVWVLFVWIIKLHFDSFPDIDIWKTWLCVRRLIEQCRQHIVTFSTISREFLLIFYRLQTAVLHFFPRVNPGIACYDSLRSLLFASVEWLYLDVSTKQPLTRRPLVLDGDSEQTKTPTQQNSERKHILRGRYKTNNI